MRVLGPISAALRHYATDGRPCYPQGFKGWVHQVSMALGWMAKGYQYDKRTFLQRMTAGNYHWKRALGFSHSRAVSN